MAKNKSTSGGLVYSTDPSFSPDSDNEPQQETLPPAQQKLRVRLDTKHRAGKAVTLVEGFAGSTYDAEALGKKLKAFCGTGGAVKDGEIIVQGDNREKVMTWLLKNDYKLSQKK
ncbi:MAG: translation initiation factor [Chitinophagaceae bacterium]|nr:MAG: translation initiation factor [Chitinophagaceae bacterium]